PKPSREQWHSPCFSAHRRSDLTSRGFSRARCRAWASFLTARCHSRCAWRRWLCSTEMHFKRFRSTSVRDGLRAVREELGPNALVLSTSMVSAPGWRGWVGCREVEIVAALERELSGARLTEPAPRHAEPTLHD